MSKSEIDLSLFKWCDSSVMDELHEKSEVIESLVIKISNPS
jgi:hypothetical protein